MLCLSVATRVSNGGKALLDAHVIKVIPKEVAGELGPIVGDDPIRDSKAGHQILDELECRVCWLS